MTQFNKGDIRQWVVVTCHRCGKPVVLDDGGIKNFKRISADGEPSVWECALPCESDSLSDEEESNE